MKAFLKKVALNYGKLTRCSIGFYIKPIMWVNLLLLWPAFYKGTNCATNYSNLSRDNYFIRLPQQPLVTKRTRFCSRFFCYE